MKPALFMIYFLTSSSAFADTNIPHTDIFAYALVIAVALVIIVTLAATRRDLIASPWSLSDALSEEATTNLLDKDGKPIVDANQQPMSVTLMRASASRLIALMGLIGIFSLFIGFGLVMLKDFACTGTLPDDGTLTKLQNYFYSGLVMFAPYLINKASGVFDFLSPQQKP